MLLKKLEFSLVLRQKTELWGTALLSTKLIEEVAIVFIVLAVVMMLSLLLLFSLFYFLLTC